MGGSKSRRRSTNHAVNQALLAERLEQKKEARAKDQKAEGKDRTDTRRWRTTTVLSIALGIPTIIGLLFGTGLLVDDGPHEPSLLERVKKAYPECSKKDRTCKISEPKSVANGNGQMTAVAVNLVDENSSVYGAGIAIFDPQMDLKWSSPLESSDAGYGSLSLDSDLTNHLFIKFANTNHSTEVWVIDPSTNPVNTFGTTSAKPTMPVDSYSRDSVRRLYAPREGWPASQHNRSTSRDVFKWDGEAYRFAGCELIQTDYGNPQGPTILETRSPGSPRCVAPVG